MAKVIAPNPEYSGISATVKFQNGVGETDDQELIKWFKEHGYKVEKDSAKSVDAVAELINKGTKDSSKQKNKSEEDKSSEESKEPSNESANPETEDK